MRNPIVALASVVIIAGSLPAFAQAPRQVPRPAEPPMARPAPPPAAPVVRYLQMNDLTGDLPSEAILKETRQGTRVTAVALDVCYAVAVNSNRKDRFVINLAPEGNRLVGSGQTQETKQPVRVDLTRQATADGVSFEGTVRLGAATIQVNSADNGEQSEADFNATPAIPDDSIVAQPDDFAEVSPNALALRVKREALVDVVRSLKAENVRIAVDSLAVDCANLREGHQNLRLKVDPERAAALVTKLKAHPGVTGVGWTRGDYGIDNAVRLADPQWRAGGRVDKDKLTAAVGAALAKALSATLRSADRDAASGEITLKFKRPNSSLPELGLSEIISIAAVFGSEKPGAAEAVVVWLGISAMEIVDDGPEPRLALEPLGREAGEPAGVAADISTLLAAIAGELKGQTWNPEQAAWK